MKSIEHAFYCSKEWKVTREAYLKSVGGLCELCKAEGIIKPAEHVHHKIWLDKTNYKNPEIAFGFENLQALCHDHHNRVHAGTLERRYKVDEFGRVIEK